MAVAAETHTWTFLSNHAHVLICVAQKPDMRVRDIAGRVGITERAVMRIIAELVDAEILNRVRNGRRNRYEIRTEMHLRHPIESHCTVGALLKLAAGRRATERRSRKSR